MHLAEQFASLIDDKLYLEAGEMISETCEYHHQGAVHQGRTGIIAMYREYDAEMRRNFDEVTYTSGITIEDSTTCVVHFFDILQKGGKVHESRSEQRLQFDNGLIVRIEQRDVPGEAEALRAFWQTVNNELATH